MFVPLLLATFTGAVTYPPAPGPLDNPLKGWAPYAEAGSRIHRPYSMFYTYAKWRDLEPTEGKYEFEKWEKEAWETSNSKGKHVIFRVFLDYPTQPTGVPQWLLDSGLEMKPYTDHGGGKSPDYSHPKLRSGMLKLIEAMGKRYNKHPRVAFIQIGMLGHWGEWHTWPREDLFPDEAFQMQILEAFRKAFPDKKLMARNPASVAGKLKWIGFHDDMIPYDTLGPDDWMFLPSMKRNGSDANWKTSPVGGEMVPGEARKYMGVEYSTLNKAIDDTKISWIGPYCPAHVDGTPEFTARCDEAVRRMGYDFRWLNGEWTRNAAPGKPISFNLTGENLGVAPFYYPWRVEAALLDSAGNLVSKSQVKEDIRTWMPGKYTVDGTFSAPAKSGKYVLGIGIVDPYRNVPSIKFANAAEPVRGYFPIGEVAVR